MSNKEKMIHVTSNEAENIFTANQIMKKYFYCKKILAYSIADNKSKVSLDCIAKQN